ncbi:MAG TPA: MFS transporter [Gemmatimonadaceae bacterium]|nr:MFS transporter [Gemmatimonadaceae bacterium]
MAAPADPYAALRYPNFRRYIGGLLALTISIQVQGTIVGWQMYDLTGDALALGLIGLAEAVPFISTALWAGHVADRYDRRRQVLWSMTALVVCSGALLALSLSQGVAKPLQVTAIYVIIVVSGVARSFLMPARVALGAELVPRAVYPNAITWRASTWQAAAVIGPAVGGVLYAVGGAALAYATDTALMLVGMAWIFAMDHRSPVRVAANAPASDTLFSGFRFVRSEPTVLGALTLDLLAVFFGGATALLPIFAKDILHVGPTGLGILRAAPAAGAVLIAIVLATRPVLRRTGPTMLGSVALFGVATVGFGLSHNFWLSVALLALTGAFDMVSVVIRSTLLQIVTPEPLLGRVSAVNSVFVGSSNEIGAFESGFTAKFLGPIPAVVLGGCATLAVVAGIGWRFPRLRRLDALPSAPT